MNTFLIVGSMFSLWMLIPWFMIWGITRLARPDKNYHVNKYLKEVEQEKKQR